MKQVDFTKGQYLLIIYMRYLFYLIVFVLFLNSCSSEKICSDEDRGCNLQAVLLSNVSPPEGIYLYSSTNFYQGNLAAFGTDLDSSLHNICYSEKIFAQTIKQTCNSIHPFVSTVTNPLSNFPTSYSIPSALVPIRGARGELIASDWTTFLSVAILLSMANAGVTTDNFWTFSQSGGGYNTADNCLAGADTTVTGASGVPTDTTNLWLNFFSPACTDYKKVLCICY